MIWKQDEIQRPTKPFIITSGGIIVEVSYDSYLPDDGSFLDVSGNMICQAKEGCVIILNPAKVKLTTHLNPNK